MNKKLRQKSNIAEFSRFLRNATKRPRYSSTPPESCVARAVEAQSRATGRFRRSAGVTRARRPVATRVALSPASRPKCLVGQTCALLWKN